MEEIKNIRTWLSGIIGVLVCLVVFWLMPTTVYQPSGLILPSQVHQTKQLPPIIPEQVRFYASPPDNYQTLGTIRIMRHFPAKSVQNAEKEIMQYAQKLAAKAGANGVVVKFFAHSVPGAVDASQSIYSFTGLAIYTNDVNNSILPLSYQMNSYELGVGY